MTETDYYKSAAFIKKQKNPGLHIPLKQVAPLLVCAKKSRKGEASMDSTQRLLTGKVLTEKYDLLVGLSSQKFRATHIHTQPIYVINLLQARSFAPRCGLQPLCPPEIPPLH